MINNSSIDFSEAKSNLNNSSVDVSSIENKWEKDNSEIDIEECSAENIIHDDDEDIS